MVVNAVDACCPDLFRCPVAFKILYREIREEFAELLTYVEAEGDEHHSFRVQQVMLFKALDGQLDEPVFRFGGGMWLKFIDQHGLRVLLPLFEILV